MSKSHIIAIPLPAQGHVMPLMVFSQCLAHQGLRVTFVNTELNHKQLMDSMAEESHIRHDHVHLVSIPDEDKTGPGILSEATQGVMHQNLEELIKKINQEEGYENISCLIADYCCGWALEVAHKLNITRVVAFWPAAVATLALNSSIPKLIHEGIIDDDGTVLKREMIQLAPNMPTTKSTELVWACTGNSSTQKILFQFIEGTIKNVKLVDRLVCNSAYELEPAAFGLEPQILPIGPLLSSKSEAGSLRKPNSNCLKWLDEQAPRSVIYVAFGSTGILDQTQFQELALALELANRPFLWVVRPGSSSDHTAAAAAPTTHYPEGYEERASSNGLIVGWAPQKRVLAHPSVACFISHCGWNSTMEGVSNGVPFLCWPYFADQFIDESYICDVWKVGLRLEKNERGNITRGEIKNKVEKLLGEEEFRARALQLKEIVMNSIKDGGQSNQNFQSFIEWIKS